MDGLGGKCVDVATCTGEAPRGYCPGAANIRCCLPPQSLGGPTQRGAAWLTRAGNFAVSRRDRSTRKSFPSHSRAVNKFVLHTVEGGTGKCSIDSATRVLDNKGFWPHFAVGRDCSGVMRIWQVRVVVWWGGGGMCLTRII